MTLLAQRYAEGRGLAPDFATSANLLERAAQAGDPEAMVNLARYYGLGRGVPRDPLREEEWFRQAEALGSYAALLVRANRSDPAQARELKARAWAEAKRDASAGDPSALVAVLQDRFVQGDRAGVDRWLGPGLEWGLRQAHLIRGYFRRWGLSDPGGAAQDFRRAFELGSLEGGLRLGALSLGGDRRSP